MDTLLAFTLNGLLGGLFATAAMTWIIRQLGLEELLPAPMFWARHIADGDPDEYHTGPRLLHYTYGVLAGGIFGAILASTPINPAEIAIVTGMSITFSFILFVIARRFWLPVVIGFKPDPEQIKEYLLFHIVYGSVLGPWMSLQLPF